MNKAMNKVIVVKTVLNVVNLTQTNIYILNRLLKMSVL